MKTIYKIRIDSAKTDGSFTGFIDASDSYLEAMPVIGSFEFSIDDHHIEITECGDISFQKDGGRWSTVQNDNRFDLDDLAEKILAKLDHHEASASVLSAQIDRAYDEYKDREIA